MIVHDITMIVHHITMIDWWLQDRVTEQLVYDLIKNEYTQTRQQVLMTTQASRLLSREYVDLRHSLRKREMFLTPLNHIQVRETGRLSPGPCRSPHLRCPKYVNGVPYEVCHTYEKTCNESLKKVF